MATHQVRVDLTLTEVNLITTALEDLRDEQEQLRDAPGTSASDINQAGEMVLRINRLLNDLQ